MRQVDSGLITQAEFARRFGVTKQAVARAVREGRITTYGPSRRVHAALAAEQWRANTRERVRSPADGPQPEAAEADEPRDSASAVYRDARGRREAAEAELAELKLARERGALLPTADVLAVVEDTGAMFQQALKSLRGRLAAELAHQDSDAIGAALAVAFDALLRDLAAGFAAWARPADGPDTP